MFVQFSKYAQSRKGNCCVNDRVARIREAELLIDGIGVGKTAL
jgi:hypothetical protein